MDVDIFADLKQLDETHQRVNTLIGCCAKLFSDNYSEQFPDRTGNFSWPYDIRGKQREIHWPDYRKRFPNNPRVSPLTNALCGWSVSNLVEARPQLNSGIQKMVADVAGNLGELPLKRLHSRTFTDDGEIFIHAQVLRFLASQRLWKSPLFEDVLAKVNKVIDTANRRYHPFFLHYCVLAKEEVRITALTIAESVLGICDLADKIDAIPARATGVDVLTSAINSFSIARSLRDRIESFATSVNQHLRLPQVVENLDNLVLKSAESVGKASTAIKENGQDITGDIVASLRDIFAECIELAAKAIVALPSSITARTADQIKASLQLIPNTTKETFRDVVTAIQSRHWYSDSLKERLSSEVVSQISYAASNDESRLDIGALTYSLTAALRVEALQITNPLSQAALTLILKHEHGGRWRDIRPMSRSATGFVHFPLNLEIANALLGIFLNYQEMQRLDFLKHLDEVMAWVSGTVNSAGVYQGWCSEHDYDPERIDFWATAQVIQFLVNYREFSTRVTVRSTLERAGLITVQPNAVGTLWKSLAPTDLERPFDQQVLNKLSNRFAKPYERTKVLSSSSVLLYGPPGTSKTSLMEGLANRLGWDFLQISPADFLSAGGEQVEAKATLIFEILKRAKNLVVLFDEVDEFLFNREAVGDRPQGIFRFMTTSMLPKLQSLRSRRSLLFGIATNYMERLDRAITRLGRVDYDWAVFPPDFTSRILLIKKFDAKLDQASTRKLAAETPFFTYLELKKAVEQRTLSDDPWDVVRHPTASPEAYENRPDSDDEFSSLLQTEISDEVFALAREPIKTRLASQLDRLLPNEQGALFSNETNDAIKALAEKLRPNP